MSNRKATLEVYHVPEGCSGRAESTWTMSDQGILTKQNLILNLIDLDSIGQIGHPKLGEAFYRKDFEDSLDLSQRVLEISQRFNGTHSRINNGYYDNASFGILQKDELIEYIEQLAQVTQKLAHTR